MGEIILQEKDTIKSMLTTGDFIEVTTKNGLVPLIKLRDNPTNKHLKGRKVVITVEVV